MIEDKNNTEFDLLMRSVLGNGREEVPAHVWDAVSDGLDTIARRKRTVLMWRRAAVSCSIAAALAAGLFFAFSDGTGPDTGENMIAVVTETGVQDNDGRTETLLAEQAGAEDMQADGELQSGTVKVAGSASDFRKQIQNHSPEKADKNLAGGETATDGIGGKPETAGAQAEVQENGSADKNRHTVQDRYDKGLWEDWPEDEDKASSIRTSVVFSGITGTNSTRSHTRQNLMKRPTVPSDKPKTGITETSTNTTYGIPLSFGAGVKVDLTKRWSLGTGLNYTLLNRKFYGNYTKATPEGEVELSVSSDIRNTQHYIGIPLNAYFNIVDNRYINFYAYSGGAVEKCIADRYEVLNAAGDRLTHTEKVKGVQLSANFGIGAEFMIGQHIGIYVDPSLRYYFNNGQPKSIRTAQPLMLGFEMGIRARL